MRVKLLKLVYIADGLRTAGEMVELDREVAHKLVLLGAAEPIAEKAKEAAKEEVKEEAKEAEPVPANEASSEQAAEPPAKPRRRKE